MRSLALIVRLLVKLLTLLLNSAHSVHAVHSTVKYNMYIMYISLWISYNHKMERINGAKIDLERLSGGELENLKEHVLTKLDEVLEDYTLVMDEIHTRQLDQLQSEVQESVSGE